MHRLYDHRGRPVYRLEPHEVPVVDDVLRGYAQIADPYRRKFAADVAKQLKHKKDLSPDQAVIVKGMCEDVDIDCVNLPDSHYVPTLAPHELYDSLAKHRKLKTDEDGSVVEFKSASK